MPVTQSAKISLEMVLFSLLGILGIAFGAVENYSSSGIPLNVIFCFFS